jgi:hypothetical protein
MGVGGDDDSVRETSGDAVFAGGAGTFEVLE